MNHNYKKLNIWIEGIELVQSIYEITLIFPDYEKFGLVSQMNRCVVSIPSNIAEGTSKSTVKHFKQFLETSLGSCFELETQLIIANKLNYINSEKFEFLESKIKKTQNMIFRFKENLKS